MTRIIHEQSEPVDSSQKTVFTDITNSRKFSSFFPNTYLALSDDEPVPRNFEYVAVVTDVKKYSKVYATISSVEYNPDFPNLECEWSIDAISPNKSQLSVKLYYSDPVKVPTKSQAAKVAAVVATFATTTSLIPLSYAAPFINTTNTVQQSASTAPVVSSGIIANSGVVSTTTASTIVSQKMIGVIALAIIAAGGGIVSFDALYSDPQVNVSLYPLQLPAELFGSKIYINEIVSSDDKSSIVSYDCNNEDTFQGLQYSFDCIVQNSFGNTETVNVTVSAREPNNRLSDEATACVEQYYERSDDIYEKYPYLLNLPNASNMSLETMKKSHTVLMDRFFEEGNYKEATEHATIVLRYFSVNDPQALSSLGNIMRDTDRTDIDAIRCALEVHETPYLQNTPWGKLSLAEDNHVLGNFETASNLASTVIEMYNNKHQSTDETTYKNALIIKANALFRIAMEEIAKDTETVKYHYTMAHNIEHSYDSWFGLGNLERYHGNFQEALDMYSEAKKLAVITTEIDKEMEIVQSYLDAS